MASTKELKQRIKGIKNTGKITRAMEMISAVKMRKAVQRVLAIRPYAQSALRVLEHVSQNMREEHPFMFRERPTKNVLIVAITSNRGLCGSFNAQVMRRVRDVIRQYEDRSYGEVRIDILSLGKKGDVMLRRFDRNIIGSFPDMVTAPTMEMAHSIARFILDEYRAETYEKVLLVYTDYISAMTQKTQVRRILPLSIGAVSDEIDEMIAVENPSKTILTQESSSDSSQSDILYAIEPNVTRVQEVMVPRLLAMQLYHAVLESNASQEAARMMAMRNATDAAKDMVNDFTLAYNQLRQAKVTQEIAELSAGMAAVEG